MGEIAGGPIRAKRPALGDITNLNGGQQPAKQHCANPPGALPPCSARGSCEASPRPIPRIASAPALQPVSISQAVAWSEDSLCSIDRADMSNPQTAAEYARDVVESMQQEEADLMPKADYMETMQATLSPKMRGILVDWLCEVHLKFKLGSEAMFLCVNLIDRYLSVRRDVDRSKLQLVGVTCMLIASKYEEIYPPAISEFVYITDSAYSRAEILAMETQILNALNFKVAIGTPFRFLMRYAKLAGFEQLQLHAAQYLLELVLPEYEMMRHKPSHLAAAVVYLCNKIFKVHPSWANLLSSETHHAELDIRPCAKEICSILQRSSKRSLQAVRKKFSSTKFDKVAQIIIA